MRKTQSVSVLGMLLAVFLALQQGTALALDVKQSEQTSLSAREFFKPELRLSSNNVPASAVLDGLANKEPWAHFLAAYGHPTVFFDPRSGIPSNVILSVPMLPGTGQGNTLENTDRRQPRPEGRRDRREAGRGSHPQVRREQS